MIIVYIGRRGTGKTLTMVKDAYNEYCRGRTIYTNLEGLQFPHVYVSNEEIREIAKDSTITNCVLVVDELQIFFDSRRSQKQQNINFSNFIQQIRKRHIKLLGTTQFANSVDVRFRDHTDIVVKPKYIDKFKLCEVQYIDITSTEEEMISEPDSVKVVYDCTQVFKLYNTEQIIT